MSLYNVDIDLLKSWFCPILDKSDLRRAANLSICSGVKRLVVDVIVDGAVEEGYCAWFLLMGFALSCSLPYGDLQR